MISESSGIYIGIDVGKKKIGLATSDPTHTIATPRQVIFSDDIWKSLKRWQKKRVICGFVVGLPLDEEDCPMDTCFLVKKFVYTLKKHYPTIPYHLVDEWGSTWEARRYYFIARHKKMSKYHFDAEAASIILQRFLDQLK